MSSSPYHARFTSAHNRARILKILLNVGAVATGMSLLANMLSLVFPSLIEEQVDGDDAMSGAIALAILLVAVFQIIIYLATVIFFLMWLYRAYDNLRVFKPWRRRDYSPGWAVASFFVPFVNLVIPYRAVREVWQKSGPSEEEILSEPNTPAFFPIWWTFWLLSVFASRISNRASFRENVPEKTATMIAVVAGALSIMAALLAYLVVDAIDDRQEETSKQMKLGTSSGPPLPPANLNPVAGEQFETARD